MNKIADALEGSIKMSAHQGDRFERDVVGQQAWRAVQEIRRLVTERNALEAERDRLRECLHDFIDLADHSEGVAGWHLNGDILTWEEIEVLTTANDLLYPTQCPERRR